MSRSEPRRLSMLAMPGPVKSAQFCKTVADCAKVLQNSLHHITSSSLIGDTFRNQLEFLERLFCECCDIRRTADELAALRQNGLTARLD